MGKYFLRTIVENSDFRMLYFKAEEFKTEKERDDAIQAVVSQWLDDDEYEVIDHESGIRVFIGKTSGIRIRFSYKKA